MTFPTFQPGEVLGAADMNAVGLWLVRTQTIQTSPAVTVVTVNNAFSSDYDNYLITLNGGTSSSGAWGINMRLGSTISGYYYFGAYTNWQNTSSSTINASNAAEWGAVGISTPNNMLASIAVYDPFRTRNSYFTSDYIFNDPTGGRANMAGYLADNNSYTSFTLFSAGSFSQGTIRVYGMKK